MYKLATHHSPLTTHHSRLTTDQVYAVILVGGKGKRLRPLSTNARPKAFLSITKDRKTMFRRTVDRIKKILPSDHILVAANRSHRRLVQKDFPDITNGNLILEPVSRNTAPAIALAAAILQKRSDDAIMVVVPTDQHIIDEEKYLSAIKCGIDFVRCNRNALIVLGIKPTYPATGFGYLRLKTQDPLACWAQEPGQARLTTKSIYKVEKFVEKPSLAAAKRYLRDDRFLWNAGAFIFLASSILNAVKKYAPEIFNGLKELNSINKNYRELPDRSIDYAVMEKADEIWCAKGSYGWNDVGSFDSLKDVLTREGREFVERDGKVIKIL